jgi:hypothetical protein
MINYVRTDEQTWSKHRPETAINQGKEMVKIPGRVPRTLKEGSM